MAIALFSAHYHEGQGCRIYRMGCRAGKLFEARTSAGAFVFSRQWDRLEGYVSGDTDTLPPATRKEYADAVRDYYQKLVATQS